jgi:hypothetical protein
MLPGAGPVTDIDVTPLEPDVPPSPDGLALEPPRTCPRCHKERPAVDFERVFKTGQRKRTCRVCLSTQRDRQRNVAMTWAELAARPAPKPKPAATVPTLVPAAEVVPSAPRPVTARDPHRTSRIHMNGNVYDRLFREQGGRCKSCDRPESALDEWGHTRKLVAFFDANAGFVKGLICADCNGGFDRFCCSPVLMAKGLAFLTSEARPGVVHRMEIA